MQSQCHIGANPTVRRSCWTFEGRCFPAVYDDVASVAFDRRESCLKELRKSRVVCQQVITGIISQSPPPWQEGKTPDTDVVNEEDGLAAELKMHCIFRIARGKMPTLSATEATHMTVLDNL